MRPPARRRAISTLGLSLLLGLTAAPARAEPTSSSSAATTTTSPEAAEKARQHFQRARALYQAGSYREAIAELEAARALDPQAKDLVYNLGVVYERLGQIEDALRYFHEYEQMDLQPAERARADAYVKRLEGAKHEVEPTGTGSAPASASSAPPPPPPPPPPRSRIDVATVIGATLALAGLSVGTVFGIKALSDSPPSSFVTGRDGTYQDLQSQQASAHREAIVADIGLGVGVAAALVTAYLYFGRSRGTSVPATSATVSAAPAMGGGALLLQGSF